MQSSIIKKLSILSLFAGTMMVPATLGSAQAADASSAAVSSAVSSSALITPLLNSSALSAAGSPVINAVALQSRRGARGGRGRASRGRAGRSRAGRGRGRASRGRGFRGRSGVRGGRGVHRGRGFRGGRGFKGSRGFRSRGFRGGRGFRHGGFHSGYGGRRFGHGFYSGSNAFFFGTGVVGSLILIDRLNHANRHHSDHHVDDRRVDDRGDRQFGSFDNSTDSSREQQSRARPEILVGSLDGDYQPAYNRCASTLSKRLSDRGIDVSIPGNPQSGATISEDRWRFNTEFTTRDDRGGEFLRTMTCEATKGRVSYLEIS